MRSLTRPEFNKGDARRLLALPRAHMALPPEGIREFCLFRFAGQLTPCIVSALDGIDDEILLDLAKHTNIETGADNLSADPPFWNDRQMQMFPLHLAEHRICTVELQAALAEHDIAAPVAHEDIQPGAEWQKEIVKALQTRNVLVALLHPEFRQGIWTDHETDQALGRGIPASSIRLGRDLYACSETNRLSWATKRGRSDRPRIVRPLPQEFKNRRGNGRPR